MLNVIWLAMCYSEACLRFHIMNRLLSMHTNVYKHIDIIRCLCSTLLYSQHYSNVPTHSQVLPNQNSYINKSAFINLILPWQSSSNCQDPLLLFIDHQCHLDIQVIHSVQSWLPSCVVFSIHDSRHILLPSLQLVLRMLCPKYDSMVLLTYFHLNAWQLLTCTLWFCKFFLLIVLYSIF